MFIDIIKVFILSLVEGLTEFIPVSSTGHMIIVDQFLQLSKNEEFANAFKIIIQLGAILSVVVYYWKRIFPFAKGLSQSQRMDIVQMWIKIVIAVLPAVVLGLLFDDVIDKVLFNSVVVAITLIIYGVILIWLESGEKKEGKITSITQMPIKTAIGVGLFQCLAMIPGTSRSAATIIGGVLLGLNRILATEFSFFLAIPKLVKLGTALSGYEWFLIALGFMLSFIFAYAVIKVFMSYIKKHDFKVFGYYRIILGIIVLALYFVGVIK